jgi:probable addiction module antidote protein
MAKGISFREDLNNELKDPESAAYYLIAALEENDEQFFREALADVVKIHGFTEVASQTGIARQALYKMLSENGNPSFKNITLLLDAVGLELTVQPKSGRAG